MEKEKEKLLARNNLAKTMVWKEIKTHLYEEIKEKANPNNGDYIVGMLKAIDVVDGWVNEFNRFIESIENQKGD